MFNQDLIDIQTSKLELMSGQLTAFLKWANATSTSPEMQIEFDFFVWQLHLKTLDLVHGSTGSYTKQAITALEDAARGNIYKAIDNTNN